MLPNGFCYLENIPYDIRYTTSNNFIGRPLAGYLANKCIVSNELAKCIHEAQKKTLETPFSLLVFEAYRPLKAVEDIVQWSLNSDTKNKDRFYPNLNKSALFEQGYIALRSTHTRGAAVDITLVDRITQNKLDMSTEFDFFETASHTASDEISAESKANRALLLSIMESSGFINYDKEWWHFTLKDEPFPNTYFDFDIA